MPPTTLRRRLWTTLAATALAVPAGAASAVPISQPLAAVPAPDTGAKAQSGGEGVESTVSTLGGEGGEGGEGGVSAEDARTNPVAYLVALEVIAAHYLAGRDAYFAGENDTAAAMFAHPMAEAYADMEPVFAELGVPPFLEAMESAIEAALDGRGKAEVASKASAVLAALRRAEAMAPDDGRTPAQVHGAVLADLVDRASLLYQRTKASGDVGDGDAYVDGYGFTQAAQSAASRWGPGVAAASADVATHLRAALDLLSDAFPDASPAERRGPEPGKVLAASSRLALSLGRL